MSYAESMTFLYYCFLWLALSMLSFFLAIVAKYHSYRSLTIILVGNACYAGLLATGSTIIQASNMLFNRCYMSQQSIIHAYLWLYISR
jgi:hypothetical protein